MLRTIHLRHNLPLFIIVRFQSELGRDIAHLQLLVQRPVSLLCPAPSLPDHRRVGPDASQDEKSEVAIELEGGNGAAAVVVRVGLALDGVVRKAPLVEGAAVGDETGEEGEAYLDQPGTMEGQAGGASETGGAGAGAGEGKEGGSGADEDGDEEEVEVAVLDAVEVLAAEVEQEELLGEGGEAEEVEEGRRKRENVGRGEGEEAGEGIEEEEGGSSEGGEG